MKQSRKRTAATGEGGEGGRRKALKKDGLVNDLKDQNQRELDGTGKLTKCFQCDTTLNTESGVYVLECKAVWCGECTLDDWHAQICDNSHKLRTLDCYLCEEDVSGSKLCDIPCGHPVCEKCIVAESSRRQPFGAKSRNYNCCLCSPLETTNPLMLTEGLTFGNRLNHHCALTPTVLSKAGAPSIDQGFDCIGKFLFRIEEMVWFQKDTGLWGLGIIWKRWIPKEWLRSQNYVIRPLSHPFDNSHTEFTLDDTRLRPWLARSPPKYDAAYLQENPGLSYDQIDWLALSHECFRGLPGDHMLKEEAAIVAAKTIDATYTLVDQVKKTTKESYWDSMYLGAEKIYTGGDLIRLHDNQILAVDSIIERVQLQEARLRHSVLIVGDIYAHAVLPTSGDSRGCGPNTLLPYRLLNDITWCNNSLIRGKPGYWKLVATRHTVSIHQVKGRWYETSVLSPNLSISENSAYSDILKPRGHATAMERGIRRMGSRMTAFFDAIPHTDARATELPKDVDSPKRGPHSSSV